jgi:hypothetical protein
LRFGGPVALSAGTIEADLSGEGLFSFSFVAAAEFGVRRLSVPARGDRDLDPLVPPVQPVLKVTLREVVTDGAPVYPRSAG